jgi:hypothetical protein
LNDTFKTAWFIMWICNHIDGVYGGPGIGHTIVLF